jgi:hypothetical protein
LGIHGHGGAGLEGFELLLLRLHLTRMLDLLLLQVGHALGLLRIPKTKVPFVVSRFRAQLLVLSAHSGHRLSGSMQP